MDRLPYDAKHTIIINMDRQILALWTPNPDLADQLKQADADGVFRILVRDTNNQIEAVAAARRFYRRDGADFSGWVVESAGDRSDGIANKRQAMQALRIAVTDYFARS